MNEQADEMMIHEIEAAVRNTAGVTAIFPVGGMLSQAIDAGAVLIGAKQNPTSPIRWEPVTGGSPRVEAAIGVHAVAGAAEISDRVHEEVAALCARRGYEQVEIRITVVQVDDA